MHGSVLEHQLKMHLDFTEKPNYLLVKQSFRYFSRTLKYIVHSETNRLKGKHFRRVVHSWQKYAKMCNLRKLHCLPIMLKATFLIFFSNEAASEASRSILQSDEFFSSKMLNLAFEVIMQPLLLAHISYSTICLFLSHCVVCKWRRKKCTLNFKFKIKTQVQDTSDNMHSKI